MNALRLLAWFLAASVLAQAVLVGLTFFVLLQLGTVPSFAVLDRITGVEFFVGALFGLGVALRIVR